MSELIRPKIEDYEGKNNYEQFFADMEAFMEAEKIQKFEIALKQDYGIDDKTWKNTPDKMKKLLADMHEEGLKHAWIMEELECWRDNMPI